MSSDLLMMRRSLAALLALLVFAVGAFASSPDAFLSYDAENRLVKRGAGLEIGYDHNGNRVWKRVGAETTSYLVDELNPTGYTQVLAEYTSDSAPVSSSSTVALRGAWRFEEDTGFPASDASGNANHGTLSGDVTRVTGFDGRALKFGSPTSRVKVEPNTSLNVGADNADFTVVFWLKLVGPPNGWYNNIVRKGDLDVQQRTFAIWRVGNQLHYCISTDRNSNRNRNSLANLVSQKWTHIAYIKRGQKVELYLDGVKDSEIQLAAGEKSLGCNAALYIGQDNTFNNSGTPYYGSAIMEFDELQIYDGALSPSDLAQFRQKLQVRYTVGADLISQTRMDGGTPVPSYYGYDGQGSVRLLFDASGDVSDSYDYGPFGEVIRATGHMAKANPFRFSTKYQDDETDLLYYGYRYYSASMGRWISRDPLMELGGKNLYSFVNNAPIVLVDKDGRDFWINTYEELTAFYEQKKELYDAVTKSVNNAKQCKPWCGGISSPLAYYCKCVEDHWRNADELASCMCVQIPDDKDCKARIKAKFGEGIRIADAVLKTKEGWEKAKELNEKLEELENKLKELDKPKQECCK